MWKKPSLQKPDFLKVNLDQLSEKESLETNGGLLEIAEVDITLTFIKIEIKKNIPPPLTGKIARPIKFLD